MNPIEARAALDGIDDVQRALALKATYCPPWRHAAFGLVMALLVLGQGFGLAVQMPMFAAAMLGVVLLVVDDRRRYGLFVNGYRKGRTRLVSVALLIATLAAMGGEIHAREAGLSLATKLALAGLAFAVAVAASVVWSRVYRRELTGGRGLTMEGIDPLLNAPARLQIAALLAKVSEMEFAKLRELVQVSDSVLSKHLAALGEANYVRLRKAAADGRQRTWASLSRTGHRALTRHVAALRAIVAHLPVAAE